MSYDSIAFLLLGFMFYPIYIAQTLASKDDQGKIMPVSVMLKIILYAMSAFTAFFSIQLALGISVANSYPESIERTLGTIYELSFYMMSLMLIILLFGTAINMYQRVAVWAEQRFKRL